MRRNSNGGQAYICDFLEIVFYTSGLEFSFSLVLTAEESFSNLLLLFFRPCLDNALMKK